MAGGHAYTTLGALKTKDAQGNDLRLVKVRNPWGWEVYHGPYSDSSDLWTDELRQETGYAWANDGVFWIDIKTYKEEFTDTSFNRDV